MYRIVVKKDHVSEEWQLPLFPNVNEDKEELRVRAQELAIAYPAVGIMDDDKNIEIIKRVH